MCTSDKVWETAHPLQADRAGAAEGRGMHKGAVDQPPHTHAPRDLPSGVCTNEIIHYMAGGGGATRDKTQIPKNRQINYILTQNH